MGTLRGKFLIHIATFTLAIAAGVVVSGCIENMGTHSGSSSSGSSTSSGATGGTTTGGFVIFNINGAAYSNQNPNTQIDVIGSNGDIGQACPQNAQGASRTDCKCVFNWTEGTSKKEAVEIPSRTESNLIRCTYTQVPTTITEFQIKIFVVNQDASTNSITFKRSLISSSMDPTNALNYLEVKRFSCKMLADESVNQTNLYTNLLDPRLWKYNLAINFYATSLGLDYGATRREGGGQVPGWECPSVLNDPSEKDSKGNKLFGEPIYTKWPIPTTTLPQAPGSLYGYTIWPVDDDIGQAHCLTGKEPTCKKYAANRHDFVLSAFYGSRFTVPFCAYHRVSNIGDAAASTLNCAVNTAQAGDLVVGNLGTAGNDIIGFAANPEADGSCPGPEIVKIPDGMKWVKVWRLRASINPRRVRGVTNQQNIGQLFCTNRNQECLAPTGTGGNANTVCWDLAGTGLPTSGNVGTQESKVFPESVAAEKGYGNCDTKGGLIGDDGNGISAGTYPNGYDVTGGTACSGYTAGTYGCCSDNGAVTNGRAANFAGATGGRYCNPALKGGNGWETQGYGTPYTSVTDTRDPINYNQAAYGGPGKDIWLIGNGPNRPCIEADTLGNGTVIKNKVTLPDGSEVPNPNVPRPYMIEPIYKDGETPDKINPYMVESKDIDSVSRGDYIYIVTPKEVTLADMMNTGDPNGASKIFYTYAGLRQMQNEPHTNVTAPVTVGDVLPASGNLMAYEPAYGSSNSNIPLERATKFPLCALQYTKPPTK